MGLQQLGQKTLKGFFNDTPGVDMGDVGTIAGAWHATDAASLSLYDFNGNNFVDIEGIMTVVKHLGEPCL